ncbi:NMT1/THI5 like protein [Maribacter vaceletii]|uniref:NMT1/THI5 like protein n=1 Tax=Maribacter vaceletii TaxID=1206816 RepID=A0A495E898_9FLAO|nr:substrate-binding domain-containing protein [Maribacter vaceletii]RKR13154.1 NMT1/THI5 like protein [Maribacter vaceletii]
MKTIKIIGVPEHFNLPWHLAIEEGAFLERGINLEWTDIPEGTGKMCQMLESNDTDLAIILTEGIIKSIHEGNPCKIVQEYIGTPLQWGIHVDAKSTYTSIKELQNTKAAISRYGSGSHLMAYIHAQQKGWDTGKLKFEVINNLNGAIEGLANGKADYFMWEHFTTKPHVDNQSFRRLDDFPTPWPCFVIAGTKKFLEANNNLITHILEVINTYTSEFKSIPSIDRTLSNKYEQKLEDIQEWLSITSWSQNQIKIATVIKVQESLKTLNLIQSKLTTEDILY